MQVEKIETGPAYMAGHGSAYEYHGWRSDQQAALDAQTLKIFAGACRAGDANALCEWAPTVSDWSADKPHARRVPLLHEVMAEALDFSDGPCMSELMQLVLNVAHGSDLVSAPAHARTLLERMASEWVKHCGPEA
jgi:hypothetical protein